MQFVQGDCLKPEQLEPHIAGCTTVIHSVGAITDAFNYKSFFKTVENLAQVG